MGKERTRGATLLLVALALVCALAGLAGCGSGEGAKGTPANGEDAAQKGKTIFVAVADDQVDVARKAITDVTGDLSQPNAGVLFGVPISFAEGVN